MQLERQTPCPARVQQQDVGKLTYFAQCNGRVKYSTYNVEFWSRYGSCSKMYLNSPGSLLKVNSCLTDCAAGWTGTETHWHLWWHHQSVSWQQEIGSKSILSFPYGQVVKQCHVIRRGDWDANGPLDGLAGKRRQGVAGIAKALEYWNVCRVTVYQYILPCLYNHASLCLNTDSLQGGYKEATVGSAINKKRKMSAQMLTKLTSDNRWKYNICTPRQSVTCHRFLPLCCSCMCSSYYCTWLHEWLRPHRKHHLQRSRKRIKEDERRPKRHNKGDW